MEKAKKIKLFLSLAYILIIITFLFLFFNKFSISDLASYEFIKKNIEEMHYFKNSNLFVLIMCFVIFTIIWVLILGFGSPIFLTGGFLFGQWLGTFIVTFSLTLGATILYIISNYFLKDFIEEKFSQKFFHLKKKFKKNEFIFMLLYRFIGGIPFFIANILPCLFNVKVKNYFFATLFGMLPQLFVGVSLGNGIEKIIIENDEMPSLIDILTSEEIYYPLSAIILLIVISIIFKKKIFN